MSTLMLSQTLFWFQTQTKPEVSGGYNLFLIVGMFVIMYFLLIRPQVKQQREHKKLVDNLKAGDKVVALGGLYGEIERLDEDKVLVKIADKTKVYVARSAVNGLQGQGSKEPEKK